MVRLVRIESNGVVVVVGSIVVGVMMGDEELVTIRFTCRGK